MGWKAFKQRYNIEHFVQLTDKGLCIGSGYVHDLAVVDLATGTIQENRTFRAFIEKNYPALHASSPAERLSALAEPDVFSAICKKWLEPPLGSIQLPRVG